MSKALTLGLAPLETSHTKKRRLAEDATERLQLAFAVPSSWDHVTEMQIILGASALWPPPPVLTFWAKVTAKWSFHVAEVAFL